MLGHAEDYGKQWNFIMRHTAIEVLSVGPLYFRSKMKSERIIIIDGSGYIFRAYYAIQRLSTSKGFPTNAIYGFINMLMKVLDVEKPTKLLIAFDTGKPTFRKERYAEYKANRTEAPDDLKVQFEPIQRAVDCFGIHRLHAEGYEADDVIATVAERAKKEGFRVEIITGDKDLMQLVTDEVTLYDTMKDKRYDRSSVVEKLGVTPEQVVDLLALMGDSSDNIPGVSGVGEKTATELLKQFGDLDSLYRRLDEIKQPKRRETLAQEKESAYLSRELATVKRDVPVDFSWKDLDYSGPVADKLKALFEKYEFQNLLKRFDFKSTETEFKKGVYETISSESRLKEIVAAIRKAGVVSVDTETTSLMPLQAGLVGVSLSYEPGKAYYLPVGHHAPGDPSAMELGQMDPELLRKHLKPMLEDESVTKIGQNLKYDLQIFRKFGIELKGIKSDTLLASYLLDPEQPHNLDALAFRHLGHQNITYEEVTGTGRSQINFSEVTIEKATQYAAEDADVALRLHTKLVPLVDSQGLGALYRDIELPLLQVLGDMEYLGVPIDEKKLRQFSNELAGDLTKAEQKIFELCGEPFNINSPKQLSKILFEKLKLPIVRKTKTGISTDESVLEKLAAEHAVPRWIVTFRELGKLRSTYAEGLLTQINPETGRVHTHYNQTVTATGRLSSSNPNLQNIPAGQDMKYDIRSVFVAPEGCDLLSADYSQVELRLLAGMSRDPELLRAFAAGEDIHVYTAKLIFGVSDVSPEQRKVAKTINFGVTYGQTAFGLSQMLGITPSEAKQFIDKYFERYARIRGFYDGILESARDKGYVSTRLGRRRYLPEIKSSNRMRREMAERAAINAPVQGTAADMIKIAMVRLHQRLIREKLAARMIMQVHDELVLQVPVAEKPRVEKVVREEMENALDLDVPIKVDVGWGKNWRECD